ARRRRIPVDQDGAKRRLCVYRSCREGWSRRMRSLRARIVVTLVLSIICVVGLSTATLLWSREGHEQKEQEQYAQLVSDGILLIAPFFRGDEADKDKHLRSSPVAGEPRPGLTDLLQSRLRGAGSDLQVVVTQPAGIGYPMASIRFKSGWLAIPVRDRHPKGSLLIALAGWIVLVAA